MLRLSTTGLWLMPDADDDGVAEFAPDATSGWLVNLDTGVLVDGNGNSGSVTGIEDVEGSTLGDTLIGDSNANVLNGYDGDDILDGGRGDDVLNGGSGDDELTGGQGRDLFAFGPDSGNDVVTDFRNSQDVIRFDGVAGVDDFSDLVITGSGRDTLITWGDGTNSILLEGTHPRMLDASDFLFI